MTLEEAKIIHKWMIDAAEEIESWGAYASEYFQNKHRLQDDIDLFLARAEDVMEMVNHDGQHQEKREEGKNGTPDAGRRLKSSQRS